MLFRNKYNPDDRVRIYSKAGTDIVPVFALSDDETMVIQVGKKSVRDEINSFKDSTDIEVIQKQLLCGNETIANVFNSGGFIAPENAFFDDSLFPQTMSEYKKIMAKAMSSYNSIPKEIRDQFNSINDFINASDDKLQTVFDNYNAKRILSSDSMVESKEKGDNE